MVKVFFKYVILVFLSHSTLAQSHPEKVEVLIVDGFNNHNWKQSSLLIKEILEKTGLFNVAVSTAPAEAEQNKWEKWRPNFEDYEVIIQNFTNIFHEEIKWPREVEKSLEAYVKSGGGLYIFHAANSAFPHWEAYNVMMGLGWRSKDKGWALKIEEGGAITKIPANEGKSTYHGPRSDITIHKLHDHPIHNGFPKAWKAADMELYQYARGPAKNLMILSYAKAGDEDVNWPVEWVVAYGKGNVYNSSMGHLWKGDIYPPGFRCVGFQTVLIRTTEWLATGKTTYKVPENFPTLNHISLAKEP